MQYIVQYNTDPVEYRSSTSVLYPIISKYNHTSSSHARDIDTRLMPEPHPL